MPARKKPAPKVQPPRPELSLYPRKGRVIVTLVLCLLVFVAISQTIVTIILTPSATGPGSEILFVLLYLVGMIYLLGLAWSALRLLADRRPSFQANDAGITLRHLPFVGTLNIPWSEIQSVHAMRSLFLTHLCIVPRNARQLINRRNLLPFALNASARLGMRTNTPLSISQSALTLPVRDLVARLVEDYGVKETTQQ